MRFLLILRIFRFWTSTCENSQSELNNFGTRKLCLPGETSSNESSESKFMIDLEESDTIQNISLTIWGFLVKCGAQESNQNHILKFNYQYVIENNIKAEAELFNGKINL